MAIYETVRPVRLALGAAVPRSFLPTEIQDTPEQSATIAMETRYTTNGHLSKMLSDQPRQNNGKKDSKVCNHASAIEKRSAQFRAAAAKTPI